LQDPRWVVFKRYVPEWEKSILLEHSRKVRWIRKEQKLWERRRSKLTRAQERAKALPVGRLRFHFRTQKVIWYDDEKDSRDENAYQWASWRINPELVSAPGSTDEIDMSEEDIVMIGFWAANRAALWLGAQDSKPLLDFVDSLGPYVYVV
jgi:hypothetical protein